MRILALDLSLTATGYADSDGNSGVMKPPPKMAGFDRITWIREQAVYARALEADVVVIEGYAFGAQKQRGVHEIAELGGVIRCALYDESKPWADIPPASLKLFATGKGNAKKDEVFAAAIRHLGYSRNDHNEADALWLLAMATAKYSRAKLPETKARAIAKVAWPALSAPLVPENGNG